MTAPLLKLEHLEVRYGDLIGVSDVSLEVPEGSVVALLGSNGGGKTTTLNAIAGLIPVYSGSIIFRGEAIAGQTATQTVGQIQLAVFPNEAGLDAQGSNLFLQTTASGNPTTGVPSASGFGSVMQGFVESSNVNVVSEVTNLITAQRAYEMNSKVITASDDLMQTLTNLK